MIENDEIYLTELSLKDREFYCDIYTNKQLMEFVNDSLNRDSINKSFNIILNKMSAIPKKLLLFVVKYKKDHERLSIISLRWNQQHPRHVEIGIIVLEKYQRQGVGHQAKNLLIEHAFEKFNVNTIIAVCAKDNDAANCANKKLGFKCVSKNITNVEIITNTNQENRTVWEKIK